MSDSTAETVGYEQNGHVVTITYRRPEVLNAVNGPLRQELNAAWERFRDDPEAWVAIVTGEGRAFCAGADLKDGAGSVGTWPGSFWEIPTLNSFESGWEIFKPTIAAVNGPCIGYGLTAAAACDFLLAAESATFAFPEVRIGVPTIVGALRLPPKLGWQHAMELLLLGDPIDAARAQEIGLTWKVVPDDQLMDEARDPGRPSLPGALRWPSGPPRRWPGAAGSSPGSTPSASARPCAGSPASPRTPRRASEGRRRRPRARLEGPLSLGSLGAVTGRAVRRGSSVGAACGRTRRG